MSTLIVTGMISQRSDIWKEMDVATGNETTGAGLDDLWDMLGSACLESAMNRVYTT
jgi:hypothetical protein